MLDAITLKHRGGPVVTMDRARDRDSTLGHQQTIALVDRDRQMIGYNVELLRRHIENRTAIDRHSSSSLTRRLLVLWSLTSAK